MHRDTPRWKTMTIGVSTELNKSTGTYINSMGLGTSNPINQIAFRMSINESSTNGMSNTDWGPLVSKVRLVILSNVIKLT